MTSAEFHSLAALRILRRLAPDLCRAAGKARPPSLLEEGLPDAAEDPAGSAPGEEWERWSNRVDPSSSLDRLVEWWAATHPDRKGAGLFLTSPPIARALLSEAARDGWRPRSVLDPSVGAGVFLLEARRLFGRGVALQGIDQDPMAVAATRLALWIAGAEKDPGALIRGIRLGDALVMADEPLARGAASGCARDGGVDLVCGNPPFGNAIEKRTALPVERRARLGKRFQEVARGPYDRSVLFVRVSADALSSRGRIALLVPRALLAARYAEGLRDWCAREVPLSRLIRFANDSPCPDAAITMVGWIAGRAVASSPVEVASVDTGRVRAVARRVLRPDSWGSLLDPLAERIEEVARAHPALGGTFLVRSGATVKEAYEMVRELEEGGDGWRFLTSGLITRYGDQWGSRPARHLGRSFERPVLPRGARSVGPARRALYDAPKIVVCGLSRTLRAQTDPRGEIAGAVGTTLVLSRDSGGADPVRLRRLGILLNSAWFSMVHRARRGAVALSGGNVPLGRKDVEEFPLPTAFMEVDGGANASGGEAASALELIDGADPLGDDERVQRAILTVAGYGDTDARAILAEWTVLSRSSRPSPSSSYRQ